MKTTPERDRLGLQAGAPPPGSLERANRVHLIGMGGIGMSGLARLLLDRGAEVTGSDLAASPISRSLEAMGAGFRAGHDASHVDGAEVVIVSNAVPPDNPELLRAVALGMTVLTRVEAIAELARERRVIAVAGTHGKTTTSALLGWLLLDGGYDPSILVGGIVPQLQGQARLGKGNAFVIEADEYRSSFLGLDPHTVVVTHIEFDHPDYYANAEEVFTAFKEFARRVPEDGKLYICADHPQTRRLAQEIGGAQTETYGLQQEADWMALDARPDEEGGYTFQLAHRGQPAGLVKTRLPGLHNVRNALGALAAAHGFGAELGRAVEAIARFRGVDRRFQVLGEARGVTIIDDYAHHPTEIEATTAAARQRFPNRRIWVAFQPHTYSRTQALFPGFVRTLALADRVVVSDIYPAREPDPGVVHARDLAHEIGTRAIYGGTLAETASVLEDGLRPGDVLLILGAGDVREVGEAVLQRLREKHGEE